MAADTVEDVGLVGFGFGGTETGPVVARTASEKRFELRCAGAEMKFFTDPTEIVGPPDTVGAANRKWVHDLLDEFIDEMIEGGAHG